MLNFYSADTSGMNWFQKLLARSLVFTFFVKHGFSYAIKWYTQLWKPADMPFDKIPTHVSIGKVPAGTVGNRYIIFESEETQKISQWDNPAYSFVYLKDGKQFFDEKIFWSHVDSGEKRPYAFFQLLFFIWRYLMKKYFKKDVKKNWFTNDEVCSEWGYIDMSEYNKKYKTFKFTVLKLRHYNQNTFAPIDCYNVCSFAQEAKEGKFTAKAY